MSTELIKADAYAQASLDERRAYVATIAQAGDLLPRALWAGNQPSPAKVLLLAETGSMLGLHPMAALQSIHIIEGKPTLSANLLAALVRRAGHRLRVTTSGDWKKGTFVARAVLIRSDDPDFEFVVEWTKERATTAGLAGKGNWNKYPEAMCKARAITEVIREGAPDVTIVAAYTPEELGAAEVTEDGEVVSLTAEPTPVVSEAFTEEVVQRWVDQAAAAGSVDDLGAIWGEAQKAGALSVEVDGIPLGQLLRNLKAAFEAAPVEDVEEAEVVEDEPVTEWATVQPGEGGQPA